MSRTLIPMYNSRFKDRDFLDAINTELMTKSFPAEISLKILKLYEQLNLQKTAYEYTLKELLNQHAEEMPNNAGFKIKDSDISIFEEKIAKLNNTEVQYTKIQFNDIKSAEFSPKTLLLLAELIAF